MTTTAHRTGTVHAEVIPDHTLIAILGTGFDTVVRPDFRGHPLCQGVTDTLYLLSSSSSTHFTSGTLESSTAEPDPPAPSEQWQDRAETRLRLTRGRIYISAMFEGPLSPELDLGGPGDYHVRVHSRRCRTPCGGYCIDLGTASPSGSRRSPRPHRTGQRRLMLVYGINAEQALHRPAMAVQQTNTKLRVLAERLVAALTGFSGESSHLRARFDHL